jgi:hypothetical protein
LVAVGVQAHDLGGAGPEAQIDVLSGRDPAVDATVDLERRWAALREHFQAQWLVSRYHERAALIPDIGAAAEMTTASSAGDTSGPPAA